MFTTPLRVGCKPAIARSERRRRSWRRSSEKRPIIVRRPRHSTTKQMLTWLTDKPNEDPNVRGDAFKTLMVARLSYEADERDLEKEFGRYGPIERVCNRQ